MTLLEAALAYAARGWPVFPCHPKTKQPLVMADVDPVTGERIAGTGGLKKASKDPEVIRGWWTRWPFAMIGLPTGAVIGAFVMDLDAGTNPDTGETFTADELITRLQGALGCRLPATWTVTTPRGGRHLYFREPTGAAFPRNRAGVLPRIDVRGEGGYVIAPPSQRADGKLYEWLVAPNEMLLAKAPAPLIDLVGRRRLLGPISAENMEREASRRAQPRDLKSYGRAALQNEIQSLRASVPGTRNEQLFKASIRLGQLVAARALDTTTVRSALEGVVREWPNVRKSTGTIESGLSKGLLEPRELVATRGGRRQFELRPSKLAGAAGLDALLATYDTSDLGNARRFVQRNQDHLKFCSELGWLCWASANWSQAGAEMEVKRAVQGVIEGLAREAEVSQHPTLRDDE